MAHVDTLSTSGDGTWVVPEGVTSVQVEVRGAGASGGANGVGGSNDSATGGGGGAYSKKNALTVVPGTSLSYHVGAGGASVSSSTRSSGNSGEDTWFKSISDVLAKGGGAGSSDVSGNAPGGGAGGAAASGVGDTKHSGGRGGNKNSTAGVDAATGGGGSAGDTTDGGNGADIGSGNGAGGSAGTNGGQAGTAGASPSTAGSQPGAGSGGARSSGGTAVSGKGGDGQIVLTYVKNISVSVSDTTSSTEGMTPVTGYHVTVTPEASASTEKVKVSTPFHNQEKSAAPTWSDQEKST